MATTTIPFEQKLEAANKVLQTFARESRIERRKGGFYVVWPKYRGDGENVKRWICRGQDFYPMWSNKWPHGGTACTALSQLIRWLRGQATLPIVSWRYWASDTCKLLPREAATVLLDNGYPEHAWCVLCDRQLTIGFDWWNLNGVSGPCCGMRNGCRQVRSR